MKVKELRQFISKLDGEMEIIISNGNDSSPLCAADADGIYVPDTDYCGELYSSKWTAEDACMSEEEWEKMKKRPKSLILFPTN